MAIILKDRFWKKGFMFTFVSIFLISIFAFVLYAASSHVMMDKQNAAAERTEAVVVNMFTKSLSDDVLTTIVKVAGANSLRAMVSYVNATETAIDDPEAFYREVMMNGTVSGTYDVTSLSDDFAMTLTAWNDTEFITIAETSSSPSSESFGDTLAVVQRVSLPSSYEELESLHSMTVTLENTSSATSNVLYAVVYNETGSLVALDIQYFGSDGSYTFTFGGELPLTQETYYDVVIAAPFTESDSDYSITSGASDFSCASGDFDCGTESWEWDITETTGTENIPIDFYLDSPIVGEGFFLGLLNSFEALAEEQLAIDVDINVTSIVIDETGPWEIDVNTTFAISTTKTTVSFSGITGEGFTTIPIVGLYDPYSILRTDLLSDDGRYFPIVVQNVSDDFSEDDMYQHIVEHTFVFNEDAPSFLERFKGEDADGSSCCGIQAVYQSSHISGDVAEDDTGYSFVDYMFQESTQCNADGVTDPLYYPSSSGSLSSAISTMKPWFDYASIEFYHMDEMSGVTVSQATCPTT
ncbi:hypothetical protein HZC31_01080 [Candidatus Woesearchaeota archaeon]|nr:hypothetical protein [Candidatus Woesearchaeota archaeon]